MPERVVASITGSVHEQIQIVERGHLRFMRFGPRGGWQGAESRRQARPVFGYQRAFASFVHSLSGIDSFLCLGVGTGTALKTVRASFPGSALYGLELDEQVVNAAIRYFGAPRQDEATYWIGDGVLMLCQLDMKVDLIFVDAYMEDRVYGPCLHPNFPQVLCAATSSTGAVVCNLITRHPIRGAIREFLENCCVHFPGVYLLPVGPPLPFVEQNVLCVLVKDKSLISRWQREMARDPVLRALERWIWPLRLREYAAMNMV
jgi:spermidine synthase